jgi:iron-sulfur cluster assembly accessory protein
MIRLTPNAVNELIKALQPEEIVRIAVRGGGCSGMSYSLSVETDTDEEDILLDIPGVKVYIDPYSADILKETTVDYTISLQQQGFVFSNPRANTTCGCGSSFS